MDSLVYTGGRLMRGCLYGVSWDLGLGFAVEEGSK